MCCSRDTGSHSSFQYITFFDSSVIQKVTRVFKASYFFTHQCPRQVDKEAIPKFPKAKKGGQIMGATNLFEDIINISSWESGNAKACRLILVHVLTQMKCCLFSLPLSSFHKRGRGHYIRTVKIFKRKPAMLYTVMYSP